MKKIILRRNLINQAIRYFRFTLIINWRDTEGKREKPYLLFSDAGYLGRMGFLLDLRFGRSRNLITVDDQGVVAIMIGGRKKTLAHHQDRPFSCPFSAPAILYRPLAPRTGRGLMEIYDSHLIGFNVPRISSSAERFLGLLSHRVLL